MKSSKTQKKIANKFTYEIDNILGFGNFGKVYKAYNL